MVNERLQDLEQACADSSPAQRLHDAKDALSWALLDARLAKIPQNTLQRVALRVERERGRHAVYEEHEKTNQAIKKALTTV